MYNLNPWNELVCTFDAMSNVVCPYILILGQRINLTIFDFGVWTRNKNGESNSLMYCNKYAVINEKTIKQETPICAGDQRVRNAYVSKTSSLDLTLMTSIRSTANNRFLLKFEGKIISRIGK